MGDNDGREATGKVQSYFNEMSSYSMENDALLKMFKRNELESTMAASTSGAYYSYWTVDKIGDLNNLVDSTPGCSDELKGIFDPGKSKNPRLRGNRIGKMIFEHIEKMMEDGGGMPSAPVPEDPPATAAASSNAAFANDTPAVDMPAIGAPNLLEGQSLSRYVFSPDLPANCQLRLRDAPSTDGNVIMQVTAVDTIWGSPNVTSGDWLRVKVDGHTQEAWMMTTMGGTSLLVPESPGQPQLSAPPVQSATIPATQLTVRPSTGAPPSPRQNNYVQETQQQPNMLSQSSVNMHSQILPNTIQAPQQSMPTLQQMGSPSRPMTQMGMSMMNPMNQSQMFGNMPTAADAAMEGQPVPYEMYRRLEMRVNRMEVELANLKMCLRSV